MPLYELVAISRPDHALITGLLRQISLQVLHRGGVVRSLNNMQKRDLPYRMKSQQEYHTQGHYFSVLFDCGCSEISGLNLQLKLDPRVIRATIIKVGVTLEQVSGLPQTYLECLGFPYQARQSTRMKRLTLDKNRKPFPGTEWEWLAGLDRLTGKQAETLVHEIKTNTADSLDAASNTAPTPNDVPSPTPAFKTSTEI